MVIIKWTWEDIETLHPSWSKEQCEEALEKVEKTLQDMSIQQGWEVLEDLLGKDEYDGN